MERDTIGKVNETILNILDRADRMETGSQEQTRAYEAAIGLMGKLNEDYKIKEELDDKHTRTLNEKESSERDIEVRKLQIEEESKSKRADRRSKALLFTGLVAGEKLLEYGGHLIPKWFNKLYPRFKD